MIKEFDSSINIPGYLVRPLHTQNFDLNSDLIRESVREVYGWANDTLMDIIRDKMHLREGFMAVKHFYFGDCGDLLVHFMDLAKEELKKSRPNSRLLDCGSGQTAELPRTGTAVLDGERRQVQGQITSEHVQVHPLGHAIRTLAALEGGLLVTPVKVTETGLFALNKTTEGSGPFAWVRAFDV